MYLLNQFNLDHYSSLITTLTAIFGAIAIWYQLKKDQEISRADFIVSLNTTFHDNKNIEEIYQKLKLDRDSESFEFTEDDGRQMGDYVMYFQIMNYLIDEKIISIKMVDKIFSNKFFIFVNNPAAQMYQLKYSAINRPILELYAKWHNYRHIHNLKPLYDTHQLKNTMPEYFVSKRNGLIAFNEDHIVGYE